MKTIVTAFITFIVCLNAPTASAWPWDKVDIMDQKIDGSSEKALQGWFEHFQKEATQEQSMGFASAMGSIGFLVYYKTVSNGATIPDNIMSALRDGHRVKDGVLYETLDGITPNEAIKWGNKIMSINNQPLEIPRQ